MIIYLIKYDLVSSSSYLPSVFPLMHDVMDVRITWNFGRVFKTRKTHRQNCETESRNIDQIKSIVSSPLGKMAIEGESLTEDKELGSRLCVAATTGKEPTRWQAFKVSGLQSVMLTINKNSLTFHSAFRSKNF